MSGCRTRHQELQDLIETYWLLEELAIIIPLGKLKDIITARIFTVQEIEKFSNRLIYLTMSNIHIKFAHDMAEQLFEFDKTLFANNFLNVVEKINEEQPQVTFERILKIIDEFKNVHMIIIGCRAVYNVVKNSADGEKEDKYNKLFKILENLHLNQEHDELSDQTQNGLKELLSSLKESKKH